MVKALHVIQRGQGVTIATVNKAIERQLTFHGAKRLQNFVVRRKSVRQCDNKDVFAPCKCLEVTTDIYVDVQMNGPKNYKSLVAKVRNTEKRLNISIAQSAHDSRMNWHQVEIRFLEYECQSFSPVIRIPGFTCSQLSARRAIYRDVNDNPIYVNVNYMDGCELRCLSRNCEKQHL